jgi:hypothetical protein
MVGIGGMPPSQEFRDLPVTFLSALREEIETLSPS